MEGPCGRVLMSVLAVITGYCAFAAFQGDNLLEIKPIYELKKLGTCEKAWLVRNQAQAWVTPAGAPSHFSLRSISGVKPAMI